MTTDEKDAANEAVCGAALGQTRWTCYLKTGHLGQHQAYLDTVDEVVFFGADLRPASPRRLCKACFGAVNERGFSIYGGEDVAARISAAKEKKR